MRVSTVLQFRNDKLDESSISGLLAKHELEHEPQDFAGQKLPDFEELPVKDRFYFAQYFPIKESQLSENFLEIHVRSEKKRQLLRGLTKQHCELIGVVGRRAFHIFDKTHMTWICSSKALGYQMLSNLANPDPDTDDENKKSAPAMQRNLLAGALVARRALLSRALN